ncbi:GTP-binding protein, TypA [Coemansia reversa NRRL 1564]|uniref:GTP-binding protein, TypA n=1 Tax=Coemansia reversa (strain ATCC 12441 / NRRL 1564) TaxID=763665 RepID=A0A2G5BKH7_COERN|nr:GTP-binding protein, TypA [Coemansia reversa NRRL 1564]|eukprot:PIA19499.1 GTP-binding protein, TypA [Coemansia reversa NRRL 1564]
MQSILRGAGLRLVCPTRANGYRLQGTLNALYLTRAKRAQPMVQHTSGHVRASMACIHTLSLVRSAAPASEAARESGGSSASAADLGDLIPRERIRNVGIIAHVDHGKTTLVDCLLKQSGALLGSSAMQETRVMDSNAIEKERGITILSKVTSLMYQNHRINIVDTPGHADFGGEVERILSMVDSVVLVVDASEGPMAQTKFVLTKALARGIHPLVVLNKVDRPSSRPDEVDSELLELFLALGASDEQTSYDLLYASAKEGWCTSDLAEAGTLAETSAGVNKGAGNMVPLLDAIIRSVPPPKGERENAPFSMLVTQLEANSYLGKCALGRINSGIVRVGDKIRVLEPGTGAVQEEGKVTKLFLRSGVQQIEMEQAGAGDLVSLSGVPTVGVNATIAGPEVTEALDYVPVDPPTISVTFSVNDSPLAGREGKLLTSNMIRDRLRREAETNVALQVVDDGKSESMEVRGRGELQLSVLIETMRREGFELSVTPPRVLFKRVPNNKNAVLEPYEEITIDVDHKSSGIVIEKLTKRKGELKSFIDVADKARLIFHIPTRGLLGYASEFKNDTHGTGVMNHAFLRYGEHAGAFEKTRKSSMICLSSGTATSYALNMVESRGTLFIRNGDDVYPGMIVGELSKDGSDLEVNPTKAKQLTNIRAAGKDEAIRLTPVKPWALEEAIAYVNPDEAIEVTPTQVRLRKRILDPQSRKRSSRKQVSDIDQFVD